MSDIWRKRKCFNFPRWPYQLTTVCTSHAHPETNIAPEICCLEDYFPFGDGLIFRGELLVSGRVSFIQPFGSWPLLPQKISKPVDLLPALDRQWRGLASRVGRGGELRFADGKGFPICFFCAPKTLCLCPEYMIRILNVIHIIFIYIYTWIHEALSMWTYWWSVTIQSPKTPKPKISYKMGPEPIVINGVMVPL